MRKMVRIGPMASDKFTLDRRKLIAGLGAMTLTPALPAPGSAQGRPSLALHAKSDSLVLGPGRAATPVWSLAGPDLRFKRGEILDVTFDNGLPLPAALDWRGIDGASAAQPLAVQSPLAAGAKASFQVPLRHAGTFLCSLTGLGDTSSRPTRARPLVVGESEPVTIDRDEVLLFEDWRLRADGTAVPPGVDPKDTIPLHTINGLTSFDVLARANQRVRLRFINGSQRTVIAIKLEGLEVRVMAIDSQPAEPFQARNGALVIAPGSRVDAFVDATGTAGTTAAILLHDGKEARSIGRLVVANEQPARPAPLPPAPPLPSNGLPAQLDLKNALRLDVALGGPQTDWVTPATFTASTPPAFRTKTGRTVVLALTNSAALATVFHLHGHHFRLLDRLDDGWKPFWLDTLAVEPGQTQRIAFLAEHAGRFLVEQVATDWAAPRLVRWYRVE
jgi:FtsP/CotA-like multicopper oxidase with cupredoxin domain